MANSVWVNTFGGMSFNGSATTFAFPVLLSDGTAAAPSLAFASASNYGWFLGAFGLQASVTGTAKVYIGSSQLQIASGSTYEWASGTVAGASDVVLARDAANTLALRNGTAAQQFNVGPSGNLVSLIGSVTAAAPFIESIKGTAPAAPAASKFRIFAQDSAGKTQLMVIFDSGAAQQLAIQP